MMMRILLDLYSELYPDLSLFIRIHLGISQLFPILPDKFPFIPSSVDLSRYCRFRYESRFIPVLSDYSRFIPKNHGFTWFYLIEPRKLRETAKNHA